MALHTASFPRFRPAPQQREFAEKRSLASRIPMDRLNELASDGKLRLHVTSLFVVGMAGLVTILSVIF